MRWFDTYRMKKCETCQADHSGEYASGRFCSAHCAHSFSTREARADISKRVSEVLSGRQRNDRITLSCEKCNGVFTVKYGKRTQRFCSIACTKVNPPGLHPVVGFRQRTKMKAIAYKGGACCFCGYDKTVRSLQFHHLDPKEKDFNIGGKSIKWERIQAELDKCILVCANCHGEVHDGIRSVEDVTRRAS